MAGNFFSNIEELYKSCGVLVAGFLIIFLQNGSFKAFGVLFDDVVKEYATSNLLIGGIFSFELAACYVIAGISGAVLPKMRNRTMGVIGGILFGLGFVLQGMMGQTLWNLFFFIGVSAVGVGLLYLAVFWAYVEHFGQLFYLAYSLRDVFFYIGVTVIPPFMDFLRQNYGLHGAFMIFGAITWNAVVAGVLLKSKGRINTDTESNTEDSKHSEQSLIENCSIGDEDRRLDNGCSLTSFLDISTVTNHPLFGLSVLIHSLTNFNFVTWALFLVPYGTSLGYYPEAAVYLSTSGGAGGFIGKLLVIVVFCHGKMNQIISNAIPGVIFGIALVGYVLCDNFFLLLVFSFLSGLSLAFADASTCAMVTTYICHRHLRQATHIFYLGGGLFIQLGGIVAGAILDVTSSFPNVFGVMFTVNVVIIVLAAAMQKMDKGINKTSENDEGSECCGE